MTTQPTPQTNPETPVGDLAAARTTCRELLALLVEENHGLTKQDIKLIEERTQHKRRLTLRLEQLLSELKQSGNLWKSNPAARYQATLLAEEIAQFQDLARENAMMLKAAHQLRADLIIAIRDTVDSTQPRAQVYGANGNMQPADNATRLVARSI